MTLAAGQTRVSALEHISGVFVLEGLRIPLNERKFASIMFGVAAGTFLGQSSGDVIKGVQATLGSKPRGDLGMTIQTFQRGLATPLMTVRAMRCTIERSMSFGERAGGYLRLYSRWQQANRCARGNHNQSPNDLKWNRSRDPNRSLTRVRTWGQRVPFPQAIASNLIPAQEARMTGVYQPFLACSKSPKVQVLACRLAR